MKDSALETGSIYKLYFSYFIPYLVAMLAMGTYSIVDGIFLGRVFGAEGIAALGIVWPIFPSLIAVELLFSMGGASLVSYFLGKKDFLRARIIFNSVFYFVLVFGLLLGPILFFYVEDIAIFLGSSDSLKPLVIEYLEIIFLGASVMLLHPLLDTFIIQDKRPKMAMVAMIIGAICNVILNYLFLFKFGLGISSSALSTVLGHGIGTIVLLGHFLNKRGDLYFLKAFSFVDVFKCVKNGISPAVSEFSVAVIMFLFIHTIMSISGDRGIAIYTMVTYGGSIFFIVIFSIAQAMQPLVSFNYGANNLDRVRKIYLFGIAMSSVAGVCIYISFVVFGEHLIFLFFGNDIVEVDKNIISDTYSAMKVYFIGYIFLGINVVSAMFFQSVQRVVSSFIITISYTFLFIYILLPVMSARFGIDGVWLTYPLAIFIASLVVFCVVLYEKYFDFLGRNQTK